MESDDSTSKLVNNFHKNLRELEQNIDFLINYIEELKSKNANLLEQLFTIRSELLQAKINLDNLSDFRLQINSINERCSELLTILNSLEERISFLENEIKD